MSSAGGHELHVTASGYSESDGVIAVSMLMAGAPAVDVETVRIPSHLVESVEGG